MSSADLATGKSACFLATGLGARDLIVARITPARRERYAHLRLTNVTLRETHSPTATSTVAEGYNTIHLVLVYAYGYLVLLLDLVPRRLVCLPSCSFHLHGHETGGGPHEPNELFHTDSVATTFRIPIPTGEK